MRFDSQYYPGLVADILGAHARYYAQTWSFGLKFEAKVAADLAGFVLNMDVDQDLLLTAKRPDERFYLLQCDVLKLTGGQRTDEVGH